MHILGVIPARGGSRGIPRKNLAQLGGRPLITYTFKVAQASRYLTRVIVSTDDAEIIRVATEYDIEVPFSRPAKLARDDTPDLPVFQHCLKWLWNQEGYAPEIVVHLRPTAPLRKAHHIDDAVQLLCDSPDYDSVRSVCHSQQHPLKTWRILGNELVPFIPAEIFGISEPYNQPRQTLPEAFVQNSVVDAVRTHVIMKDGSMTGKRIRPYVTDESCAVDIDTYADLAEAESRLSTWSASQ